MSKYSGKTVVIAGGSRGLGLELGRVFARQGAQIALLARNPERLELAAESIRSEVSASAVATFSVDLLNQNDVLTVVASVAEQFGAIDVWINAVGQSVRTTFAECSVENYRELMEQNFFSTVNGSLAALPSLENSGGSLVNIGSLAAKTAWPHLAPYVTSKHALAGFAKQISLEGPQNVHYLFVCPGPIQSERNQAADRYVEQTTNLPESARKPGAGAPVKAIDPVWLAERILVSCLKRRKELVVPFKSRLLFLAAELWPSWANRLIRRFSK